MSRGQAWGHGIRIGVRRLFRLPLRTPAMARDDADAELDACVEARVEHLVARGMAPADARAEAMRRLGAPLDDVRSALHQSAERREGRRRLRDRVDGLRDDVRFAGRQCAKAPGFAAIVILTLALGIGSTTAIFSVVHRLFLAPLPYPNGERIVMPVVQGDGQPFGGSVRAELAFAWREHASTVQAVAAASTNLFSMRPEGTVDTIPNASVTASFLTVLGMRPVLGRGFDPADEPAGEGTASVAMISFGMWQRAYGGRADVVGRTLHVGGQPLSIVGVTPPGLTIPLSRNAIPDIWVPAPLERAAGGGSGAIVPGPTVFALLLPGASTAAATQELRAIASGLPLGRESFGSSGAAAPTPPVVHALRSQDFLAPRETRSVQVLLVAAGTLLLIACANVANLLLARAWTRQREFAVRGALGAGRGRLARQVLTEGLLLALPGGLLGIGVGWLAVRVIVALRPPGLYQLADVQLVPAVLLWSLCISVATGVLSGSAPAMFAAARDAGDVLRRETRGGSPGTGSRRVRSSLTVLQIALSVVLLAGSGLLVRSFAALQRMPLGFEPRGLVYADVILGGPRDRDRVPLLRAPVVDRLRSLPGVTGVAVGTMPGKGFVVFGGLEAEAGVDGRPTHVPLLGTIYITPEYFRVARIALVQGRLPDSVSAAAWWQAHPFAMMSPEVLVNREFARRLWPDGSAIGRRLRSPARDLPPGRSADPPSTVVGVVDDTRMPDVRGDVAALQVYSLLLPRLGNVPYVVRTTEPGDAAALRVKQAIASTDPRIYVRRVLSGDTYLREGLAPTRFAMALLTAFALIALVLAAVGLYGVIAYGVAQRTREIGVRVALGAEPGKVLALVMGGGLRLAVLGVVVGAGAAAAATRVLDRMLYAVSPADPLTFLGIAVLVACVALLASYVPARRALRIDPAETLRAE